MNLYQEAGSQELAESADMEPYLNSHARGTIRRSGSDSPVAAGKTALF
jgi:hypothetical protein